MLSLAIWLVILWVCYGVGARVLARLGADADGAGEEIPFAVALGMGLLAYLILAAGLLGQLTVWMGVAVILVLAAVGGKHMARLVRQVPGGLSALRSWRWSALPLLVFFLAAFVFTLVGALAPATDNDYDSLVYHLAIPKVYLRDGAIHPIHWLTHSNFPFTMEMLYLLGLLLRDQSLAKLFHFGCGWLTALAIFAFARRWWGGLAGRLGAAVFIAIPIVMWQMTTAYNELTFALYAFLAVCALARWFETRGQSKATGWLWAAALMCGLALGIKMLAGSLLVFALGALLWALLAAQERARALRRMIVFGVIAGAVAAPWYVKSYLWTGNPVYPFMYEIFDGRYWTAERARDYTAAQKEFGIGAGPRAFLTLPWDLTMRPRWFFDQPQVLRPFTVYITVFGPLLLAFLPMLLLSGPVGTPGRLALLFALTYTAIWFGLSQNGRYLIPMLPALSACAGLASSRLLAARGIAASAAAAALVLGLCSGRFPGVVLAAPAAPVTRDPGEDGSPVWSPARRARATTSAPTPGHTACSRRSTGRRPRMPRSSCSATSRAASTSSEATCSAITQRCSHPRIWPARRPCSTRFARWGCPISCCIPRLSSIWTPAPAPSKRGLPTSRQRVE